VKPSSQIVILRTIVKWQAEEIEALEKRVKALEGADEKAAEVVQRMLDSGALAEWTDAFQEKLLAHHKARTLTGSIQGTNGTVTVTIPPQWEDTFDEPARTA